MVMLDIFIVPFQYCFTQYVKVYHLNIAIVYFFSELVYFFIAKF